MNRQQQSQQLDNNNVSPQSDHNDKPSKHKYAKGVGDIPELPSSDQQGREAQ